MAERRARLVEWSVLLVLISIILAVAFNYYARLAGDVQRLSFELAAQNFQTAIAGARAQWYVQRSRNEPASDVVLFSELPGLATGGRPADRVRVYLNNQGWPANTESRASAQRGGPTVETCRQLWQALLVDPPLVSIEQPPTSDAVYQIELGGEQQCRYRHLNDAAGRRFFDYQPFTGEVTVNASAE